MTLRKFALWTACLVFGSFLAVPAVDAGEPIKILFITKSSGFEHSVVHRENGELGFAEKVMLDIAKENGLFVVPTKDGGLLHPKMLEAFDVVMFYTTGELDRPNQKDISAAMKSEKRQPLLDLVKKDMSTPMNPANRQALLDWVKNGGAFVGSHTASDTFHQWVNEDGKKPYIDFVGGEFAWHHSQQKGVLSIVKDHPITSHIKSPWVIADEWYYFKNVSGTFTPLLTIDTKQMKEDHYKNQEPYPVTWIEEYGKGRIFSSALGHREDVWTNPDFQKMLVKGIKWAAKKL
jgi:uncharacterized protein